jgi:hypothetical protein
MKILTFTKFYLPGFRAGGPIRTIANLVDKLGNEFDFFVVTLDRDSGDACAYEGIPTAEWCSVGRAMVMYLNLRTVSLGGICRIVRKAEPDVIYLNSFFDPVFTQRVLFARRIGLIKEVPVVLAPRGEFSEGALRLKRSRKRIFLRACGAFGLYRKVVWQASSKHERVDIERSLRFVRKEDVVEAVNLAPVAERDMWGGGTTGYPDGVLRVCFFSRISPMKNLTFALKVMAKLGVNVLFRI